MTASLLKTMLQAKGVKIRYSCVLPVNEGQPDPATVPRFRRGPDESEVQSTQRAAAHLQQHFATKAVRVVAVPGHRWLDQLEAYVQDKHYVMREGKTDYIFYCDNKASHSMLDQLQAALHDSNQATRAQHDSEAGSSRAAN